MCLPRESFASGYCATVGNVRRGTCAGGGVASAGAGIMWVWMSCAALSRSRSLGCQSDRLRRLLGSVICGVCTTNAPLKLVASRRVASRRVFVCLPPFCEFLLFFFAPLLATTFLHFLQVFFIFCFCFCPGMDIAICVIRAVTPRLGRSGRLFCRRCFSLHSFLCFCHVLSTIVANANTRLDPNLTRSNNLESFLISRHHHHEWVSPTDVVGEEHATTTAVSRLLKGAKEGRERASELAPWSESQHRCCGFN